MFDIHYENDDFVVINKYPGVSVHKDDGDTMLVSEVARAISTSSLHLVHRLDKMTSGLLILAKRAEIAAQFSRLFEQRQIDKYYLAIGSKNRKRSKERLSVIWSVQDARLGNWSTQRITQQSRSFFQLQRKVASGSFYANLCQARRTKFVLP